MKKFLPLLFCIIVIFSSVSCGKVEETYEFEQLDNGTYEITKIIDESINKIEIPSKFKNKKVTKIARGFLGGVSIDSLSIPSSITEIDEDVFLSCGGIKDLYIEDISSWVNIDFGNEYSNPMYFASNVYVNGSKIENGIVKLPEGITKVKSFAITGRFFSVEIPSTLKSIEANAIVMPRLVEIINKSSLLKARIKDACAKDPLIIHSKETIVKYEGDYVFASIDFKNYLLAYLGNDLVVSLPADYKNAGYTIRPYAFAFSRILSIVLPKNIKEIEQFGIFNSNLIEIVNNSKVEINEYEHYYGDVDIHTGSSQIEEKDNFCYYFYDEEYYLVAYTGKEDRLVLPELYKGKRYNAHKFTTKERTPIKSIQFPKTVVDIGQDFISYLSLEEIIIDEENPVYDSADGVLYTIDGKKLIRYPAGKADSSFEIPEGVDTIAPSAFSYCRRLRKVTFSSTIKTIDSFAFSHCVSLEEISLTEGIEKLNSSAIDYCKNLKKVNISSTVNSIGSFNFLGCNIESFNVDEENEHFKSIDGVLFSKDGKTLLNYATGKKDSYYEVPNGVKTISATSFENCQSLQYVLLPRTFTGSNGTNPFSGCYNIKAIYYNGSKEQWDALDFYDKDKIEELKIYFYSYAKPTSDGLYWHYNSNDMPIQWE